MVTKLFVLWVNFFLWTLKCYINHSLKKGFKGMKTKITTKGFSVQVKEGNVTDVKVDTNGLEIETEISKEELTELHTQEQAMNRMIGNGIMTFLDALPNTIRNVGKAICDVKMEVEKTDAAIKELHKSKEGEHGE